METLNWLNNFLNYYIFIFIFIKTINTSCFNTQHMGLALFGLIVSVFIMIVNLLNKGDEI